MKIFLTALVAPLLMLGLSDLAAAQPASNAESEPVELALPYTDKQYKNIHDMLCYSLEDYQKTLLFLNSSMTKSSARLFPKNVRRTNFMIIAALSGPRSPESWASRILTAWTENCRPS